MSARTGGDGNIVYVVQFVDLVVTQVLLAFGVRVWRILGNHLQGWPLALGFVGAWPSRGSLEIPRGHEEIPSS